MMRLKATKLRRQLRSQMEFGNEGKKMKAYRLVPLKIIGLFVFLCAFGARADYFYDKYTDQPQVLLRIATAAQNDPIFKSHIDGSTAFYLKKLEYIGPLQAPFGTVHVASLFYIRSSARGSKSPPRGHSYVVFLDKNFKIRSFWNLEMPNDALQVDETKLLSDNAVVFDYAHIPATGEVLFDGKVLGVPTWEK